MFKLTLRKIHTTYNPIKGHRNDNWKTSKKRTLEKQKTHLLNIRACTTVSVLKKSITTNICVPFLLSLGVVYGCWFEVLQTKIEKINMEKKRRKLCDL